MLQELGASTNAATWAVASMLFFVAVYLVVAVQVFRARPDELDARARMALDASPGISSTPWHEVKTKSHELDGIKEYVTRCRMADGHLVLAFRRLPDLLRLSFGEGHDGRRCAPRPCRRSRPYD
jgi:hypothetical protein